MDNNGITIRDYKAISRQEKKATNISNLYSLWQDFLYNRIIRIFEWRGLPMPQRELESGLMLNGINYIAFHDRAVGFVTGSGSIYGVTRYPDIYTKVIYTMPKEEGGTISGTRILGESALACYNTSTMLSMFPFICRYASLLTHSDLTLKNALINYRVQDILVAANDSAKDSIREYYEGKYNGNPKAIIDETLSLINSGGTENLAKSSYNYSLLELVDVGNEILRNFFRDIGIKWAKEKRGNMTVEEVDSDEQLLLFNVSDMLHCREEFCNDFNKLFADKLGREISVSLSPEYEVLSDIETEVKKDEFKEG